MSDDATIVLCFIMFYLFCHILTIFLYQFELLEVLPSKQEKILLLIGLKYKLLHKLLLYKLYKRMIYDMTITYFIKALVCTSTGY